MSIDCPDSDFGRALLAAWREEHSGHVVEAEPEETP